MNIEEQLNRVRDWMQSTVCPQVLLKKPNDEATDSDYEYSLVNPVAFAMYQPGRDRLPSGIEVTCPSILVQMLEGSSKQSLNRLQLRLVLAAWNPGQHGPDHLPPSPDVEAQISAGQGLPPTNPEPSDTFHEDSEGWRDVWSFVDKTIRALEITNIINGLRIVREEPIKFGPITDQDAVVDFFPYYYAWISFAVESGMARNNPAHNNFL